MKKSVIVVGAGPGGLTSAMLLANKGYEVTVLEKNDRVGGRNQKLQLGEFSFDTGPTFLMLTEVLEDMFRYAGRNINDYLTLKELTPMYRLRFKNNKDFYPTRDRESMMEQIKRLFPGDEIGYDKYLKKEKKRFEKVFACLKLPYFHWFHYFRPTLVRAIPSLALTKTIYQQLSEYFKHEEMKISMTFQSKYLGMSPWKCPAVFTILSYMEHSGGIYHTIGGLNSISLAMAKVIQEDGGKILLNQEVKEIIVEKQKAVGVKLTDGSEMRADYVIINADFAYAMTRLIPQTYRKKYTDNNLSKRDYSCSTFMLYLGLDKLYDIPHHNIVFSDDYKKNIIEIADEKVLPADPSFYIHNPSKLDPTLAPEGKSAVYILVPVSNLSGDIDWDKVKHEFRNLIIQKIKEKTELKDIDNHIEVEKMITPKDWQDEYNVYKGATFNLSHKISQMLFLRPHNRFEEFRNCFIVGGGTHPGSGLPTIFESGRISANMILMDGKLGAGWNYRDYFDEEQSQLLTKKV